LFLGSLVAQDKEVGGEKVVIREPFANVPYVAYHVGDYLQMWGNLRDSLGYNTPKIFFVNWFRRDEKGQLLWPGYGENSRILKWIFQRNIPTEGAGKVVKTPLGFVPSNLDLRSLDISKSNMQKLLKFDPLEWAQEIPKIRSFFAQFGTRLPEYLKIELESLASACQ